MTVNELLAIVGSRAIPAPTQGPRLAWPPARVQVAGAPSAGSSAADGSGIGEPGETMVYVAVPLSMLKAAGVQEAAARTPERTPAAIACYYFSGWSFARLDHALAAPGGGVRHLRKAEVALLAGFLDQPRTVLTRRALAACFRRPDRPVPSDRAVDSYVCRLRAHFRAAGGPELIASVHSVGYRFDSDVLAV